MQGTTASMTWNKSENQMVMIGGNLSADYIFVFGANEAGRHGAGAAKWAKENRGARYGQGFGMQGNSFGIPTKDKNIKTLPLPQITTYIFDFLHFAMLNPNKKFYVTRIGCGLAGYKNEDVAPLFISMFKLLRWEPANSNCVFDIEWSKFGLPVLNH